jgi:hypothetical protein
MRDIMMVRDYPAQGIQKIEFRGEPLTEDFDMAGIVVMTAVVTGLNDFKLIYTGDIESTYPDGTPSHPNEPFFMFDINDDRFLSLPLNRIPCSLYPMKFNPDNSTAPPKKHFYPLSLDLKKGQRINALIEYPIRPVPISQGNKLCMLLVGKDTI